MPQPIRRSHVKADLERARYRYSGDGDRDTACFTAASIAVVFAVVLLPLFLGSVLERTAGLPYTAGCAIFYGIELIFGLCLISFALYERYQAVPAHTYWWLPLDILTTGWLQAFRRIINVNIDQDYTGPPTSAKVMPDLGSPVTPPYVEGFATKRARRHARSQSQPELSTNC